MTAEKGPEPQEPQAPPVSRIVLEFAAPGSAEISVRWEGQVTTAQLYTAAWFLDAYARETRAQEVVGAMTRSIVQGIQVPGGGVVPIRRS